MRCRHLTLNHLYEVEGDTATGTSATVVTLATPGGYKILCDWRNNDGLCESPEEVHVYDDDYQRLPLRL